MPYLVGILSSNGDVDWIFMEKLLEESIRSTDERRCSICYSDDNIPMALPRIWSCQGQKHVVFGPSGTNPNANNDQFEARQIWSNKQTKAAPGSTNENEKTVILSSSDCLEGPLADAYTFLLLLFLPQFLYDFEKVQIVEAMIHRCEKVIPSLGRYLRATNEYKVAAAITAKSCNLDENYELSEYIGDGVLKLLLTDSLMSSHQYFLHEGDLSILRSGK
jgi:hypothetical protein